MPKGYGGRELDEHLDRIEAKIDAQDEPWKGYGELSAAQIIARFHQLDKGMRLKVLCHEWHHKKRDDVVSTYVNWNS